MVVRKVADEAGDSAVQEAYAAARQAWSGVEVEQPRYTDYLLARVPEGKTVADVRARDLYLACACASGDEAAVALFRQRYSADMIAAVRRLGADAALADEVLQHLMSTLFVVEGNGETRRIEGYSGRGDLRSWARAAAIRTALKRLRGSRREVSRDDEVLEAFASPSDSPELAHLKREYRGQVKAAFQEALASLTARERTLLRLHYLDGLTIDHLGSIYKVHRSTAARWLAAAREQLAAETRRGLAGRLQLGCDELESIIGLVQSQLEVSFVRLVS